MITEIGDCGNSDDSVAPVPNMAGRAARAGIRILALVKECGMGFRGEPIEGDWLPIWARRAAGAALVLFGFFVLVSSLVGRT